MSADDAWRRDTFSGWTSDTAADDYGIWTPTSRSPRISSAARRTATTATSVLHEFSAAANPPAANPTTNAFRVYLPNDAGTAPVKPYIEQLLDPQERPQPGPGAGRPRAIR